MNERMFEDSKIYDGKYRRELYGYKLINKDFLIYGKLLDKDSDGTENWSFVFTKSINMKGMKKIFGIRRISIKNFDANMLDSLIGLDPDLNNMLDTNHPEAQCRLLELAIVDTITSGNTITNINFCITKDNDWAYKIMNNKILCPGTLLNKMLTANAYSYYTLVDANGMYHQMYGHVFRYETYEEAYSIMVNRYVHEKPEHKRYWKIRRVSVTHMNGHEYISNMPV